MMKILERIHLTQRKLSKPLGITHLHTNLKPPKANQTLKRCLNSNCNTKAILHFRQILRHNPSAIDSFSFLFVLKACIKGKKAFSLEGRQLHTQVIKSGFHSIIHLQTSLINLYSASGDLVDAQYVFDEMPNKNIISWTALISAYVVNQQPQKTIELFRKMQMLNVEADQVTVTVALSACADLGALEMGEWIHGYVRRKLELKTDLGLNNALINMYAKCGEIETARKLFDRLGEKDVMTWTSMIVGHALHGQANEALELFGEMEEIKQKNSLNQKKGNRESSVIIPNDVTFIGVLMACSHGGMVEEGKKYYQSMSEDYSLKPRDVHFGCMVDLFCRAGLLKDAYEFIIKLPSHQANAVMWRTLLGACNLYGDIELGERVRCKLMGLEPGHVGDSVAMSNIYAAKGMWDKKVMVRDQIKLRRAPGCSLIEVGSEISEFVSGDNDHVLKAEIYEVLKYLTVSIKVFGYSSPQMSTLAGY